MKLALFFTRSVGLRQWVESGLFDREKMIYERHLAKGSLTNVIWLTYQSGDAKLADELHTIGRLNKRIEVVEKPRWFPGGWIGNILYSVLLPLVHARALSGVDLLKTNQLDGGWAATIAKVLFGKPLLLRCGYVQSKLETSLQRLPWWRLRVMLVLERFQYQRADLALVTSQHNARYVEEEYLVPASRIRVVPNYIDELLFLPNTALPLTQRPVRLLYVGRLSMEKNLESLIRAAAKLELPVDMIGRGPSVARLKAQALECGASLTLLGTVPNGELPALINRYTFFVLPSYFEGMPKSLLEAMACGLVCIGTNVDGINEIISDGIDGFLAQEVNEESLCIALSRALKANIDRIGMAARETIVTRYTLDTVLHLEQNIFKGLVKCH
jgi:glycosyltransferase involved in cell wall biosynthesis